MSYQTLSLSDFEDDLRHAVYAGLPDVACKGLCASECVRGLPVSTVEADALDALSPCNTSGSACRFLTADKKCGIHAERPLVCRVYGVVETLPCKHGCEPVGGLIPHDQAAQRLFALADIRGMGILR